MFYEVSGKLATAAYSLDYIVHFGDRRFGEGYGHLMRHANIIDYASATACELLEAYSVHLY